MVGPGGNQVGGPEPPPEPDGVPGPGLAGDAIPEASVSPGVPASPAEAPPAGPVAAPYTPGAASPGAAPSAPAPEGWAPPEATKGGGRGRGCVIAIVAIAVLLVAGFLALAFLGGQVFNMLRGGMQFGTGGSECTVTGQATTFPASSSLHVVAYLKRDTTEGEVLTATVTGPGGTQSGDESPATAGASCVYFDVPAGTLVPGHYEIEYRSGSEVLSTGEFDVTP